MALPFNRVNGPKEAGTTTCTIDGAFAAKVAGDVAIQIACCICSVSALNASDASSVTLDDDEVSVSRPRRGCLGETNRFAKRVIVRADLCGVDSQEGGEA
jgi:hypothetical protein